MQGEKANSLKSILAFAKYGYFFLPKTALSTFYMTTKKPTSCLKSILIGFVDRFLALH